MSGILYVSFRIVQDQTKLGSSSSEDFEIIQSQDEIRSLLSDPAICMETFKGTNIEEDQNIATIQGTNPNGVNTNFYEIFAESAKQYGQSNIRILKMKLGTREEDGHLIGEVDFWIEYKKTKVTFGVKKTLRKIKIFIGTDNSGNLTTCHSVPGVGTQGYRSRAGLWSRTGVNQILYYDRGGVVIGDGQAGADLTIEGALKIGMSNVQCLPKIVGALRYVQETKSFETCLPSNQWEKIEKGERLNFLAPVNRTVQSRGKQLVTEVAEIPYKLCKLNGAPASLGQCQTEYSQEQSKWIFQAESFGMGIVSCEFSCYTSAK